MRERQGKTYTSTSDELLAAPEDSRADHQEANSCGRRIKRVSGKAWEEEEERRREDVRRDG